MDDITLANARSKLLWASQGEWSASLSPKESAAILDALVNPPATGTVDHRPERVKLSQEELRRQRTFGQHKTIRDPQQGDPGWRPFDQGDPGDEHHEPR